MNILVIHGFNSGPGEKSEKLKQAFPNAKIFTPQLQNEPLADIQYLQKFIKKHKDIHVIGTSLGGFYTMYLALMNSHRDDLAFYMINPAYTPYEHFSNKKNQIFYNHKSNLPFKIGENFLNEIDSLQFHLHECFNAYPNMYFYFGNNDEILNHQPLIQQLYGLFKPVNVFHSDQDHRHNDLNKIIKQIQENMVP
jgi:uncharacterized protein